MRFALPERPSEHFTWAEVQRSATATARGLDNTLPNELVPNVLLTAARMEQVRVVCGNRPVMVTSWYRAPAVNRAVGSSDASVHPLGLAVDFRVAGLTVSAAYDLVRRSAVPYDQLIIETNQAGSEWVHLGLYRVPRRDALRAWWDTLLRRMVYRRTEES